jgi:hypothetical protein
MKKSAPIDPDNVTAAQLLKLLQENSGEFLNNDPALYDGSRNPALVELSRIACRWLVVSAKARHNAEVIGEIAEQARALAQFLTSIVRDGSLPAARECVQQLAARSLNWPVIITGRRAVDTEKIAELSRILHVGKQAQISLHSSKVKQLKPGGFSLYVAGVVNTIVCLRDNIKRLCKQERCTLSAAFALKFGPVTSGKDKQQRRIIAKACKLGALSKSNSDKWASVIVLPWIRLEYDLPIKGTVPDFERRYRAVPGFARIMDGQDERMKRDNKRKPRIKSAADAWHWIADRVPERVNTIAPLL